MNILNDNGKYFFYNSLNIVNKLEPKNYLFNFDGFGNCFLEDIEEFKFPNKIYDVDKNLRELIKLSFNSYDKNLGVLLTGTKGQGKSLTAKLLCKEMNLPVIIINKNIPLNVNFTNFLNQIKQNYILFIDEFEKLFEFKNNEEKEFHSQESFLSFMDGVLTNNHKVLFVLTTNNPVSEFFINRPSRIKFLQEYDELPEEIFHLICDDKLINKDFKEDLEDNTSMLNLNIDLLISIIEDINLFNIPFSKFMSHYNYKFETYKYEVIKINDKQETWDGIITLNKKIRASHRYIDRYVVDDFVKFTKEEIVFKTHFTDYDEKDNEINIKLIIKLKPVKFNYNNLTI